MIKLVRKLRKRVDELERKFAMLEQGGSGTLSLPQTAVVRPGGSTLHIIEGPRTYSWRFDGQRVIIELNNNGG